MTGPLAVLRAATADRHERLDAGLALTGDDLTPERYHAILVRLLGVVEPLEGAIGSVPLDDWPSRRRAVLLRGDVGDGDVPLAPVPDLTDPDRALGAVYVLEGSLLGGRHVAAAVRERLGADAPTRWFAAGGADLPRRWQSFRRAVHTRADAGGDVDAMAAGARDAFDAFLTWCLAPTP